MSITDFSLIAILFVILQFLSSAWIKARLENSIKHEYDKILEEYRLNLRIKERAAKIAEYLSITMGERMDPTEKVDRVRANQLAWELVLWLPDDLYLELKDSLKPEIDDKKTNVFKVLIKIREFLRKEKTCLTDEDIFFNKPT
jgi:hypothetical protein